MQAEPATTVGDDAVRKNDSGGNVGKHRLHPEQAAEGDLDISVTMSEANERNSSQEFKGGDITCVMGSVKLDLTEAEIAEPPAHIHVDIVMGGLEILVPEHWIVRNDITRTMGEVEDHTESRKSADTDDGATLILRGSVVMGHATIQSASPAAAD